MRHPRAAALIAGLLTPSAAAEAIHATETEAARRHAIGERTPEAHAGNRGSAGSQRVGLPAFATALVFLALLLAGWGAKETKLAQPRKTVPVILAAGDIAACDSNGDEATARLVGRLRGIVAALGDEAYEDGSSDDFKNCCGPSWGRFEARTRPAPGNHEYDTAAAAGYFGYFNGLAGPPGKGWYSYRLGVWHITVLNSNCSAIGGCDAGSPQWRWLRSDLKAHRALCTLAYWHHPRFSSGTTHGSDVEMAPIWRLLYNARAEVVLNGHEHNYERFAPQTPAGTRDPGHGIREFVVGTGGKSHYQDFATPIANSQVRNDDTFGVLQLALKPGGYSWKFIPAENGRFSDSGSSTCHR